MNPFLVAHARRAGIDPALAERLWNEAQRREAASESPQAIAKALALQGPGVDVYLSDVGSWADGPSPVYVVRVKARGAGRDFVQLTRRSPRRFGL